MLKKLFTESLYVKVRKNQFSVKNLSANTPWKTQNATNAFSTQRLLVGTFSNAEPELRALVQAARTTGWIKKSVQVLIQPLETLEGGLSEIEQRVFKELALGAGAFKAKVYTGPELSDEQALKWLNKP
ncbi:hypothetical protein [Gilvimarinus algae]|uniref:SPOR domain-containing protein n=1 Tax=Gilvimarinus algae TaxID=3058037 RepID=A0ABT8TFT2_9GAMM|nr:hypothetical protein [Gilvimarinus sp. SDUM040014]MDO3382951.1 hypothetical protein [Gilvimarinus sp. SDUM040014]